MNPKFLTGGLLIIGSLLIFAGFGESNDELITATDHVSNIAEDTQSHLYFTLLDMTAVIAMMTGWIFLGLSMHGSGKSGSLLAKVAVTLTIICLPIVIVSSGLSLAVIYMIEDALKPENAAAMGALMVEAEWLYIISEGVSSPGVIFNVIGIAWILIGIAMILQKNLPSFRKIIYRESFYPRYSSNHRRCFAILDEYYWRFRNCLDHWIHGTCNHLTSYRNSDYYK